MDSLPGLTLPMQKPIKILEITGFFYERERFIAGNSQSDAVVGGDIQTEQYSGGEFYTVHTAQEVFGIEIH